MTCQHRNHKTWNSRPKGYYNARGQVAFDFLTYRQKKCLDCGINFSTFELTEEHIATLTDFSTMHRIHLSDMEAMQASISRYLDKIGGSKERKHEV